MLEQYRHIHFIGIGGAGMSALAYVLVKRGYDVTGSDLHAGHMAEQLAEANAMVFMGHDASQVDGADAVVVSSAIHPDNVELAAAKAKGIPVLHRSDVLKELLNKEGARGVAVAGAHGKTTTSAMISVIAAEAGKQGTVLGVPVVFLLVFVFVVIILVILVLMGLLKDDSQGKDDSEHGDEDISHVEDGEVKQLHLEHIHHITVDNLLPVSEHQIR